MSNNELNKTDIFVIILFLLMLGSYFGTSYSDIVWKNDLNNFAENNIKFIFDNSGYYYTIQKNNVLIDYSNITIIKD